MGDTGGGGRPGARGHLGTLDVQQKWIHTVKDIQGKKSALTEGRPKDAQFPSHKWAGPVEARKGKFS